jgi:hypothetical protein
MLRVVLSVRRDGEAQARDVEVPAEVPAEQLAAMLAVALGAEPSQPPPPVMYRLLSQPTGVRLRGCSTLAEAGVWDGSALLLQSKQRPQDKVLLPAYFEDQSGGGQRYPLRFPALYIGRPSDEAPYGAQGELVDLKDAPGGNTVSHQHARLCYADGDWLLTHLSKRNPTWLNGRLLAREQPSELLDGDQLRFGTVELTFRLSAGGTRS